MPEQTGPNRSGISTGLRVDSPHRLHIHLPATVTIASKRQRVGELLRLAPGQIMRFDKPCHEPLELRVAGKRIAVGLAVQVGGRWGLKIAAIAAEEQSPR